MGISLSINFIHHDVCICRTMFLVKICFNPSHQVIFERFDYLMEQIWCNKLMDICSWESSCKGLNAQCYAWLSSSQVTFCHTCTPATTPHSRHAVFLEYVCTISSAILWDLLSFLFSPSKSNLWAKQLWTCVKKESLLMSEKAEVLLTWSTILDKYWLWGIALDNQLCRGQSHISPFYNCHLHISWFLACS